MAILQPTLNSIPAFDAGSEYIFRFSVPSGSDQVVKNRLVIYNSNNVSVYDQTITTNVLAHTLAAGTLTNGLQYSAIVYVFNSSNTQSAASSSVAFRCYTTPTFEFSTIPSIITNGSYEFSLTYSQSEGELLNAYLLNLYDSQGTLVQTSNVKYVGDSSSPFKYTFNGLLNNTAYSIDATGTTVYNTILTTQKHTFTVEYTQPSAATLIALNCNCTGGYVTITSNMSSIEGTPTPNPPTYIGGEEIDLTSSGSNVIWQDGVVFSGNFKTSLWFNHPVANKPIATLTDSSGSTMMIRYCEGYDGNTLKSYVDCTITTISGVSYYVYSPFITKALSTDDLQVVIIKQDNLITITLYNLT